MKVSLGDLGSISNIDDGEPCTYPPPEFTFPQMERNCHESNMSWGLGIILLELLGINVTSFGWAAARDDGKGKFKSMDEFKEGIRIEISNILKDTTNPMITALIFEIFLNPERISLKKIIKYLQYVCKSE